MLLSASLLKELLLYLLFHIFLSLNINVFGHFIISHFVRGKKISMVSE